MTTGDVLAQAQAWLADDPDPHTRAELGALLEQAQNDDDASDTGGGAAAAREELRERFSGSLEFGTAGLRGALGAGPKRMNRAVVVRAARGLANYLVRNRTPVDGHVHHVVIGYDARHGSHQFAVDSAAVCVGAGLRVSVLPSTLPTPILAFAVRHLDADAGIMVTASHNPAQDNGYKVYLGGPDEGAQIVPPTDEEIATCIAEVTSVAEVPRVEQGWTILTEDIVVSYLQSVARLVAPEGCRTLRIVLTSMHGVGGTTALSALRDAGFTDVHPVVAQAQPDPEFPTVAFPNPEEPGALDQAFELATAVEADLVLAHDPDADRCAAAIPTADGSWHRLHGDEVGVLLGDHLARRTRAGPLACSIVSSRMLGAVATAHARGYAETLTGFKWICRVPGLAYGYEEALGYCVDPDSVRDKDGIATAVVLAELAAALRAGGRTLQDRLDALSTEHGVYLSDQISIRFEQDSDIARTMRRLRSTPPTSLADSRVERVEDLAASSGTTPSPLPPTDALRWLTATNARVILRPSGTEPKLKCYLEVVVAVGDDGPSDGSHQPRNAHAALAAARAEARSQMQRLYRDVERLLAG